MQAEAKLMQEIRLALGKQPDLVLWRNNVGQLRDERGRAVRYGLAIGSADLVGILAPWVRFVALEVKTSDGRLTSEQSHSATLAASLGAFVRVVRSVEEARAAVDEARRDGAATAEAAR